MKFSSPTLIIDSREQTPLCFTISPANDQCQPSRRESGVALTWANR